jgi:hypothetical protein
MQGTQSHTDHIRKSYTFLRNGRHEVFLTRNPPASAWEAGGF